METICKYEIMFRVSQSITMPEGAKILSVQNQRGSLCLWVQCDTRKSMQQRTIVIACTGDRLYCPGNEFKYIDTVQEDMFSWHVFEQISGGQNESEAGQ